MRISKFGAALVCAAAISAPAFAQSGAAPAGQGPIATGPAVPGVCVLSREGLLAESVVGKYVQERLHQLKSQSDAELNSEAAAIKADVSALQAQKATLPADQYEQRGAALNARIGAFQSKAQKRDAELQRTLEKAVGRVNQEAEPYIAQAFTQHNCSILFNAEGVLFSAKSMDITEQVIQSLNGKLTQFPFDREQLPDQPGASAQ